MQKLLRYTDLVERGLVRSRMTLKRRIDEQDFPLGRLISPNARAWTEKEIEEWLATRPTSRKPGPRRKKPESGGAPARQKEGGARGRDDPLSSSQPPGADLLNGLVELTATNPGGARRP
jgi:predicted DNA-binding transcriptional regulator AlpA